MTELSNKEKQAIDFIRKAETLALRLNPEGFHVAFSGGKDSQVLLALVQAAGVKYHAEMQVTTVDPPPLMRFVREYYPYVKLNRPQLNMRQLIIKKKSLPTRYRRFCCAYLKEQAGAGSVTCIGIRRQESAKRARRVAVELKGKRHQAFSIEGDHLTKGEQEGGLLFEIDKPETVRCVEGKDSVLISPILDWTERDIWTFIRGNNMPYCELYDMGFTRIDCLFCPMASYSSKKLTLQMFPLFAERVYVRAIEELMQQGLYDMFSKFEQPAWEVFRWWITNMTSQEYLRKFYTKSLFNNTEEQQ